MDLFEFQVDIEVHMCVCIGTNDPSPLLDPLLPRPLPQDRVVVAISERCKGFLRTLSLKDCQNIDDTALK